MQDMMLGRMWADHHRRIYGGERQDQLEAAPPAAIEESSAMPLAGKLLAGGLALTMAYATVGASVSTV